MPPTEFTVSVTDEIRAVMARRRVHQVDLTTAMGKSQSYWSRRLRGERPFTIDELAQIAQVLGVPLSTFLPDSVTAA